MSGDFTYDIGLALGGSANEYDIDAIAEALHAAGAVKSVDDVPGEMFWGIVAQHALPPGEGLNPLDQFKAEVKEAVEGAAAGERSVWRRGGVSLEIEGHSRVNMAMPQVLAVYRVTVVGGKTVRLTSEEVSSWPRLWETVETYLHAWTTAVEERRREYDAAVRAAETARTAALKAAGAADRARRELIALQAPDEDLVQHGTMSRDEVAQYLNIAPGSVRRQMSRWGIEAEYQLGPSGRAEVRYPTVAVQANAVRRPGRDHHGDLA
ncbi:hypothetical protein [Streptomyces sp. UNOC14_S4]|uniref:hypothetical protein n=1 Tax=Streptomyces sp. UNOC14_S4 TaxID=2872340 RepID=UPI001E54E4AB|nr:hypothetical protein [Streptomyces sp. UNOC14_S4]MCC3765989.1 hypothetical protein [Streptomyces sp. UNOC14_S4]